MHQAEKDSVNSPKRCSTIPDGARRTILVPENRMLIDWILKSEKGQKWGSGRAKKSDAGSTYLLRTWDLRNDDFIRFDRI